MVRAYYEDRNGNCDVIQEWKGRLTNGKFKTMLSVVYDMCNSEREIIATIEVNGVPTMLINGCYYERIPFSPVDEFKDDSIRVYVKRIGESYQLIRCFGC